MTANTLFETMKLKTVSLKMNLGVRLRLEDVVRPRRSSHLAFG